MTLSTDSSIGAANAVVPARKLVPVTPANQKLAGGVCRSLWINDDGVVTVNVLAEQNTEPVLMTVSGPGELPVRAAAVYVGGDATDIVALY